MCTQIKDEVNALTDYTRKTQICVRAALAVQHVLHARLLPTGSLQKLNSYIIQSSCRGRDATRDKVWYCTYTRLSTHYYIRTFSFCYQRIPKYTQRTTMYAPTHNTKVHSVYSYTYREVAVSSREERRPCCLVSLVLLQNVSNLWHIIYNL